MAYSPGKKHVAYDDINKYQLCHFVHWNPLKSISEQSIVAMSCYDIHLTSFKPTKLT